MNINKAYQVEFVIRLWNKRFLTKISDRNLSITSNIYIFDLTEENEDILIKRRLIEELRLVGIKNITETDVKVSRVESVRKGYKSYLYIVDILNNIEISKRVTSGYFSDYFCFLNLSALEKIKEKNLGINMVPRLLEYTDETTIQTLSNNKDI